LTFIQSTKYLKLYLLQKAAKEKHGSGNWPVSIPFRNLTGQIKNPFEKETKSISVSLWAFKVDAYQITLRLRSLRFIGNVF
jgi:hypothetical protein